MEIEFCIMCEDALDEEERKVWFCSYCERQFLREILAEEQGKEA